jgi:glycoside/pentoside/hexuronide:cation symporter, GPH family
MSVPPLTRVEKVNYSLGSTAEAIAFTATSSFLLLFYNQVRGLPAGHVGTALAAGLIVNALFDPLVGSWSDRTRSRLGRRHPFMFAAILPVALLFWAVFNPPNWGELGQLVWLAVCNTMLLQAMTLYHTPHLALGGEMSNDYLERTSIMGFNTVCLWLGDTIAWVLSFRFFFASSEQFKNGALDPTRWPAFSASFGVAILLLLTYSSWSTKKFIPYLPRPAATTAKFGLTEWFRDAGRALSNHNYVVLLVGLFFLSMMIGGRAGL